MAADVFGDDAVFRRVRPVPRTVRLIGVVLFGEDEFFDQIAGFGDGIRVETIVGDHGVDLVEAGEQG